MVDIHDNMVDLPTGVAFVTPFILVYGTLRLGQSNYKRLLTDTQHMGTYELPGWILSGINSGYTGDPKDTIVVDAFNLGINADGIVKTPLEIYEKNYQLDELEGVLRGGYNTSLLKLHNTPTEAPGIFKIYNGRLPLNTDKTKLQRDYVSKQYCKYPTLNPLEWL